MFLVLAKKEIVLQEKKTVRDDDSYYHHVIFKFNSIDQKENGLCNVRIESDSNDIKSTGEN